MFELLLLIFKDGGVILGGWTIGCNGEFAKFKASPISNDWNWVFPILIVWTLFRFWFVLLLLLLLFEFWFEKIWLTILFVKFLIWSELTIFIILWKGLTFWLFWFWVWFVLLLFCEFCCASLTCSSLLKTRWIIVSSLSTSLSKYSSSLNCFPLFKSLCLFGSILYISANFFLSSLIFIS